MTIDIINALAILAGLGFSYVVRDRNVFKAFLILSIGIAIPLQWEWFDNVSVTLMIAGGLDMLAAYLFMRYCGALIGALMILATIAQVCVNGVMFYDYWHGTSLVWNSYAFINAKITALQVGLLFIICGGHIFIPLGGLNVRTRGVGKQ